MVSLRRRRLILGLSPGPEKPLPLYCENIPPRKGRIQKNKPKNDSSDSEDGIIPNDRMSSITGKGCRVKRAGGRRQNSGQAGCAGKVTKPSPMPWPAASNSSQKNKTAGAEPSLVEMKIEANEEKDEKLVDPPTAVVCDNFTDCLPPKLLGSWSV